jgi:hypothetical protein
LWTYLAVLCLLHLFWTLGLAGKVSYFSNRIDKVGQILIAYADAVKMVENETFGSKQLSSLQERLKTKKGEPLSVAFHRLGQLIDKLDARNNLLVGAVLNMIFLSNRYWPSWIGKRTLKEILWRVLLLSVRWKRW